MQIRKLNVITSHIAKYTPSEAKKKYPWMSDKQAEVFSSTWTSAMNKYKDEGKAFAIALAAAKKAGKGKPDKK